jgi:hypothetical protein
MANAHPLQLNQAVKVKKGNLWSVVYKDTTVNQAYLTESLLFRTHLLQDHVEVLTSYQPFSWQVCSAEQIHLIKPGISHG